MLRPGRVAVGAVQVVAALAGRPARQHQRADDAGGLADPGDQVRDAGAHQPVEGAVVRPRPGRRAPRGPAPARPAGSVACTDGADPARRPHRGVLARARRRRTAPRRRARRRPAGWCRRPRPPARRRRRPRAASRPTRRPGRRRARAPRCCRRRASTSTPLSAPCAAARRPRGRAPAGRAPAGPARRAARWSAAASSSTPARLEQPEQLVAAGPRRRRAGPRRRSSPCRSRVPSRLSSSRAAAGSRPPMTTACAGSTPSWRVLPSRQTRRRAGLSCGRCGGMPASLARQRRPQPRRPQRCPQRCRCTARRGGQARPQTSRASRARVRAAVCTSASGTRSSGRVRQHRVAGPVVQRRDAGAGQQPQVAAVRRAPALRRTAAGHGVRARRPPGRPGRCRRPAGRTRTARPTTRPSPGGRAATGRRRSPRPPPCSSAARASSTGSSSATPSRPSATSRSGTLRRPVAGLHPADRQRVGQRPARHQRVDVGVALGLEPLQRGEQRHELLDRADALGAPRRVGREARHPQPERQRTGVGRHEVEAGRLGHDAGVGAPAAAQRGEGAEAAVLLAGDAGQQQVAAQRDAGPAYGATPRPAPRPGRPSCRRRRGRAARRRRPGRRTGRACDHAAGSPTGTTSTCPLSISGRAVAACRAGGRPGPTPRRARPRRRGSRASASSSSQRQPPVVDLEAGRGELGGEQRLDLVLGVGAAHARDAHQLGQPLLGGGRGRVDLGEHAGGPVGHGGEPRRTATRRRGAPTPKGRPPRGDRPVGAVCRSLSAVRPCRGCG